MDAAAAAQSWTVVPVAGGATGTPLYRLSGALTGGPAWSVILKVLRPPLDASPTNPAQQGWKRAVLAHQEGLLSNGDHANGGFVAARLLDVTERPDGALWTWWEDLTGLTTPRHWSLERFGLAARHLGQFNAPPLVRGQVPSRPWFFSFLRWWIDFTGSATLASMSEDLWGSAVDTVRLIGDLVEGPLQDPSAWEHPLLRRAFPHPVATRLLRLWQAREELVNALNLLPQTLVHGDPNPHNLFSRSRRGRAETVAVDWDTVGTAALGDDPGQLLAVALTDQRAVPSARALCQAVWEGYLAGLSDAGWSGDPTAVRFAFVVRASLNAGLIGAVAPAATLHPALAGTPFRDILERTFGEPVDRFASRFGEAAYVALDLADEALALLPTFRAR